MNSSVESIPEAKPRQVSNHVGTILEGNRVLYSVFVIPDDVSQLEVTPEEQEEDESDSCVHTPKEDTPMSSDTIPTEDEKRPAKLNDEKKDDLLSRIEKVYNDELERIKSNTNEFGKVDFSNDDWIRESNDYICFRLLIECFSLPSILFSFLHDCVMKYLYPTQSVRLLQADDFKRFYISMIRNQSAAEASFFLLSYPFCFIPSCSLVTLVHNIIDTTPVLKNALRDPEEFEAYVNTVIATILFRVNQSDSRRLSLYEYQHSNFYLIIKRMSNINREEDLPLAFGLNAFHVVWNQFRELDLDQDSLLSKDDLRRYGEMCLNELTLDRIIMGAGRKKFCMTSGYINYQDFVCVLLIADENKRSPTSIRYWFRILDLQESGRIDDSCIRMFYESQKERLQEFGIQSLPWNVYLMNIKDLLYTQKHVLTLHDFMPHSFEYQVPIVNRIVAIDMMVNTLKFLQFEHRAHSLCNSFDIKNRYMW
ncbi:serine threonine-protein phosphatase [Blastocystis sp. subtype 4]|uniref:serine threonine-protein phosphatase n=1 Tax=Blastocystis sp. subtype 4 TaxID=944170 RepID=UPI00071149A7|nr:serine threonine-protein phosphatase [Blastocystis sp. subtype 4]KNB43955.1 serine threonine-protein phosphatase [Blastocystis sp. subtype 4]|eukprot:XP_014527398.1 serine threonine-protein phosphatase [Blastocystis sp. subtype 4]